VRKLRPRAHAHTASAQQLQPHIERDLSQCDDNSRARDLVDLCIKMIEAARDLFRQRLVIRRGATHRHDDVRVFKSEPVINLSRGRNAGEARAVQRRHEEVA